MNELMEKSVKILAKVERHGGEEPGLWSHEDLSPNPGSTTYKLCALGQVT
jgi:hypothetical protein